MWLANVSNYVEETETYILNDEHTDPEIVDEGWVFSVETRLCTDSRGDSLLNHGEVDFERFVRLQGNLAETYRMRGQYERAMNMRRGVYLGLLKLNGIENRETLREADNYALDLVGLGRFKEAKSVLLKAMPVAQRVLGEDNESTLRMRWTYAGALYEDNAATLDVVREAVELLEVTTRTARRVLGGLHPTTTGIEGTLREMRAALAARETPSTSA